MFQALDMAAATRFELAPYSSTGRRPTLDDAAIQKLYHKTGASGAIRTPNVLEENPDLQSGAANRI